MTANKSQTPTIGSSKPAGSSKKTVLNLLADQGPGRAAETAWTLSA
jgi:hypothetical protein